jgi:hypothetical protein
MDYLRPSFDTSLLGYLSFAINEEQLKMKREGGSSDWLKVLTVVKQGVLAEFEARYHLLLEPLLLAVRFYQEEISRIMDEERERRRGGSNSSTVSLGRERTYSNTSASEDLALYEKVRRRSEREEEFLLASAVFQRFVHITPAVDLPYLKELANNMINNVLTNPSTQTVKCRYLSPSSLDCLTKASYTIGVKFSRL